MTWKFSHFFAFGFFCLFTFAFTSHYASLKTPALERGIASQQKTLKPWYDAGFKI